MSSYLDSTDLIASIVRRAHIPESQVTFQDDDFLAFANEEMKIGLMPSIMKMHQEFFVYPFLIPMASNQSYYEIPDRAIGTKVRAVFYQDAGQNLQEMARVNPEDLAFYQNRSSINYPRAFYVENNFLVMVPIISDQPQGNLIVKIFVRPNELVTMDQVSTVTAIDTATNTVTVDQIPSTFSTSETFDIIQKSGGHRFKAIGIPALTINATTKQITFPASPVLQATSNLPLPLNVGIPPDLVIGDIICLADQTGIPQMPDELHPLLAQRVACRCFEAQKDTEGLQNANAKLQEMEINLGMLIDNRTEGQPQKINNLRSALRSGKFRRRRSTY